MAVKKGSANWQTDLFITQCTKKFWNLPVLEQKFKKKVC